MLTSAPVAHVENSEFDEITSYQYHYDFSKNYIL
jgi:hypothetical protein